MHKALGRGLESLLSVSSTPPATAVGEAVTSVPVSQIKPNRYQARVEFNEKKLKELSESIKRHGLAQPLLVTTSVVPGEYELIAGERRLRASKMAGIKEVPVIVRQADEKQRFQLSLIENLQREDLNPIEEARAYSRLSKDFHATQEELAEALGKDRSVVANSMRLLHLPQDIQDAIAEGLISSGHGRILAGITDEGKVKSLAEKIIKEKLTVREVEKIVSDWKSVLSGSKKKVRKQDAELISLGEDLQRRFGTKVKISGRPSKGKIEIHYFSLKELERIVAALRGKKK
ncbi:MAG: ParB/RepB/Spo0J family partition protein [Elusimicrobiota bacterium]